MNRVLFWTPRLLMILFIGFISLFALDSFDEEQPLSDKIGIFFVHLTPSVLLILLLISTCKKTQLFQVFDKKTSKTRLSKF